MCLLWDRESIEGTLTAGIGQVYEPVHDFVDLPITDTTGKCFKCFDFVEILGESLKLGPESDY